MYISVGKVSADGYDALVNEVAQPSDEPVSVVTYHGDGFALEISNASTFVFGFLCGVS